VFLARRRDEMGRASRKLRAGSVRVLAVVLALAAQCFVPDLVQAESVLRDLNPVLQGIDLENRDEESRLSILIQTGELMPPVALLRLVQPSEIVLEIQSGEAEFLYSKDKTVDRTRVKRGEYHADTVVLPSLFAGESEFEESVLTVFVDGVAWGMPLRVATLGKGIIKNLWLEMRTLGPAILEVDEHQRFILFDPQRIAHEELEGDVGRLDFSRVVEEFRAGCGPLSEEDESNQTFSGEFDAIQEDGDHRCPVLVWYRPKTSDRPFQANNCFSNLKLFGSVEFVGVTPPAGFSVKPESASLLFAPTTPIVNLVDGLYRSSWGCEVALKIPNNVVARVFSVDASCCRGPIAWAVGKTCSWLNTSNHQDWPNCPL